MMPGLPQASNPTYADVAKPNNDVKQHEHQPPNRFANGDPKEMIVGSIRPAPVTEGRKPYINNDPNAKLRHPGTARANIAATLDKPNGTTDRNWNTKRSHQTVLQQHCEFFDTDHDGVLWPLDTYRGFHNLGFNPLLSLIALFIIHLNFSYPTSPTWLPDPFFRIHIPAIDRTKHGSDTGTYDNEGRFIPQKFEEIFGKYAEGRDYITIGEVGNMIRGQRNVGDIIGWGGMVFEWGVTWIMLWPEDGRMAKEDIRRIYDGSIFYSIAERRGTRKGYTYAS